MRPTERKQESDTHSQHTCDMSTVTLEPHAVFVLTQSVLVTCTHELYTSHLPQASFLYTVNVSRKDSLVPTV